MFVFLPKKAKNVKHYVKCENIEIRPLVITYLLQAPVCRRFVMRCLLQFGLPTKPNFKLLFCNS